MSAIPTTLGEEVVRDTHRSTALQFWKNFATEQYDQCKDALELIAAIRGEEPATFTSELSSPESEGKSSGFIKLELPLSSPRNAQDAWASEKLTTLLRVDPEEHCLAFDGDIKKHDGGDFFVVCVSPKGGNSAGVCNVGTHSQPDRLRIELPGPAYLIKVRPASAATKPKALSGAVLLESSLPRAMVMGGCAADLLSLQAAPKTWKIVLEFYPGASVLERWYLQGMTPEPSVGGNKPSLPPVEVAIGESQDAARRESYDETSKASQSLWRTPRGPGNESVHSSVSGQERGGGESYLAKEVENIKNTLLDKIGVLDRFVRGSLSNQVTTARGIASLAEDIAEEAKTVADQALGLGRDLERQVQGGLGHRTVAPASPPSWGLMSPIEQQEFINQMVSQIDVGVLASEVASRLNLDALKSEVRSDTDLIQKIQREFTEDHGAIASIKFELQGLEARKNTTSSERGGYVFVGPTDVQALIQLSGPGKLAVRCIDLISLLTLAQDPYVTYEAGIQVHANAIKANYGSVIESRIKLSFEIPYPEIIIKVVENVSTAAKGGAKFAPMFQSAELFEDDFRDGSHRRILKGIENAYELTQRAIDQEFPLGAGTAHSGDARKLHTILSDQNRRAYRQTVGFIESLLPFYRTLKGGSLTSAEAWERVQVFVLEFLTCLQEVRVISSDMSDEASMIWGCFKATDLAEEFRKQKYVEHPKALAILALTSIEREGKTMALLEDRIAKLVADGTKGEKDRITRLDTKVQQLDNKVKNIVAKNPDLK